MAEADAQTQPEHSSAEAAAAIHVAPSPHLSDSALTTRRMMIDVLIGLAPALLMAVYVFGWAVVVQVGLCVLSCVGAELVFTAMRGRLAPIGDYSAAVTGVILGLSLPANAPWYIAVIGSAVGVGLGKVVFGGLGCNIFNPAMVGRAFVMLSFAKEMGASAYRVVNSQVDVLTQATPLTAAKEAAKGAAESVDLPGLWPLFIGEVNGSPGEISALALLVGGIYLCVRRVASWEIPAGVILAAGMLTALANWAGLTPLTALHHLAGGALLLGAFFIATDPVTSPLTAKGKFIFGLGIGLLVVVIRLFSGYPEGVMFAVLLMNAVVPLINRWTIPRPLGGPLPQKT
jgi:electron transport complex protein RnfD